MSSQMTLVSSLTCICAESTDARGNVADKVGALASLATEITYLTHPSRPSSSVRHARDVI